MKRTRFSMNIGIRWPTVVAGGLAAALATALYVFQVGMPTTAAAAESYSLQHTGSAGELAANPLLLAYKLPAFLLLHLYGEALLPARLAAVGVMLASVAAFYLLARRWYGRLNGAAGAILFATSTWALHTGRYAAGYGVLLLMVLVMMNLVVWTNSSERPQIALPLFAATVALALFAPAGIWFALVAVILCRQALQEHVQEASMAVRAAGAAILAVALGLIGTAAAIHPVILRQFVGLPDSFPAIASLGKQAALSVSAFIVRGPGTADIWLAHTPVLDIASTALLILGIAYYWRFLRKPRTRLLLIFAGIGIVLTALNGAPALSYMVPVVYLVIAAGLAHLMQQWRKVFPRNPIANGSAIALLCVLLACIVTFHTHRYFVAWRHNAATTEAYRQASADEAHAPYLIQ